MTLPIMMLTVADDLADGGCFSLLQNLTTLLAQGACSQVPQLTCIWSRSKWVGEPDKELGEKKIALLVDHVQ